VMGEAVRHTKRGGASAFPGRRGGAAGQTNYAEEVAERNMKDAADFAAHFFAGNHVRRVLLGGTHDNLASFRTHLPKTWQSLIVGTFHSPMTASPAEVLEKAIEIVRQEDRKREKDLIDMVVTAAAKGREGVLGLEDSLGAAHTGRVLTLLIEEGARSPGYRCAGCGYVTAQALESCPFCGKDFQQIPDAIELAVRKVMQSGGEVEVLQNEPALTKAGGIAALLRY
jgi:peptide subunit release factor 1 (eRF1)